MIQTHTVAVLVVDDDPDMSELLAEGLSHEGFAAIGCTTIESALDLLREHEILAMVADLHMPRPENGKDLCRQARGLRPSLAIVLCSGDRDIKEIAQELGVEHVVKPAGPIEVAACLASLGVPRTT